jgi:hypothetical protein
MKAHWGSGCIAPLHSLTSALDGGELLRKQFFCEFMHSKRSWCYSQVRTVTLSNERRYTCGSSQIRPSQDSSENSERDSNMVSHQYRRSIINTALAPPTPRPQFRILEKVLRRLRSHFICLACCFMV